MSSIKNITARKHADKPKARSCGHWINSWDVHNYCPTCREKGLAKGKLPAEPCVLGDLCPVCETFSTEQMEKIATRRKYVKKPKDSSHRPDLSADLETEAESEVYISAAQEASLLELSQEHDTPAAQAHPVDQSFQGREPPNVQNVALQSHSRIHLRYCCDSGHSLERRPPAGDK